VTKPVPIHNGNHKKDEAHSATRYKTIDTNGNSHLLINRSIDSFINGITNDNDAIVDTDAATTVDTVAAATALVHSPTVDSALDNSSDDAMEVSDVTIRSDPDKIMPGSDSNHKMTSNDPVEQQIEKMEAEVNQSGHTNLNSPCDNEAHSSDTAAIVVVTANNTNTANEPVPMETDDDAPIPEELYAVVDIPNVKAAVDIPTDDSTVVADTDESISTTVTDVAISSIAEEAKDEKISLEHARSSSLERVTSSDMTALTSQHRAAALICRLIQIRTRLMNSSRCRIEAKKQKNRSNRDRRHIPFVTRQEHNSISGRLGFTSGFTSDSEMEPAETDESDIEEVGFLNDKIGFEQRKIRLREKIEEEKSRKIESRRTWLLRQIQNCKRKRKAIAKRLEGQEEEPEVELQNNQDDCARSRLYNRKSRRPVFRKIKKRLEIPKTSFEQFSRISKLDNTYHHVLSTPKSIPLSTRLTGVLHEMDPTSSIELKKSNLKNRNERREKRFSTEKKKQKQRNAETLINHIVVPTSSLISAIEMPKYKNIQTPGYRSDYDSECHTEDLDEDISHEAYVRRHIIAEKQEKMRYYQSAIQNSRRKKKQQMNPRLASPRPESYRINSDEECYGYKRIKYPIPPSQIGEHGFKETAIAINKKKKKQWRSSTTDGNGLRLKLSLRKT
jgi:hypothetical protein